MSSQTVWVKKEAEEDGKALEFGVPVGMNVSALRTAIYKDPNFAFVPGTIDCLLVRAEDGREKILSNQEVVDPSLQYEVRLKPVSASVTLDRTPKRAWVLRNACVTSLDKTKSFTCDILVDTGCLCGQLRLPPQKCQQLGLQVEREGETNQGKILFYLAVYLEITQSDGTTVRAPLTPFSHPMPTGIQTPATPADTTSTIANTTSPTTIITATNTTPTKRSNDGDPEGVSPAKRRKVVPLSPVKYPSTQGYSTILLGPHGFGAFGFDLDTKADRLYYEEELGSEVGMSLGPLNL